MMKKMTLVEKVERKRENESLSDSSVLLLNCLKICDEVLSKQDLLHSEVFFYLISYITNVESFFRHLIKEIIDKDPSHLEFIDKIVGDYLSKKDLLESIYGIGIKKVSAGEVLSQAIPISNFDQIVRYFDIFTSGKTVSMLRENSLSSDFRIDYEDDRAEFVFENSFSSLEYLFSLRHIFCHENPEYKKYAKSDLGKHFYNSSGLLDLTRILSDQLLGIPEFRCEADRREFLSKISEEKEAKLIEIVGAIAKNIRTFEQNFHGSSNQSGLSKAFADAQGDWENFSRSDSVSVACQFYGGSAMTDLYLRHRAQLIDGRIDDLRTAWKDFL